MTRNLKALGFALFAVFALGAVTASGASASVNIFDSEVQNTILTGTSDEGEGSTGTVIFKRTPSGPETICHHAAFDGTVHGTETSPGSGVFTASTIEVKAEYTTPTCTGPSSTEVHWDFITGTCGWHLTGTASLTAVTKLVCAAGGSVTETPTLFGSSLCTVHIPPQTTGGHATFHNVTINGKKSVTGEITATGVSSTRTGSSLCGPETSTTGTFNGNILITGYKDEKPEGAQVNIEVT